MTYTVAILYPNEADIKFDEDYYLKTHMPLVERTWKSDGLVSARITKFSNDLEGKRPQYLVMALLEWESEEHLKTATQAPGAATVFGDIPNFTNVKPITLAGVPREW
ncbi:hypothetical protein N7475_009282 [Penicillium sp. IBT 31633x]|nr:hypothetical protein N7475_009282 [Penicillium sp. IBT 31633x]